MRKTALTKAVDICFIISFPSIESLNLCFNRVTGAPESRRCSVGGKCAQRVVSSISGASVTRLHLLQGQIAYQIRGEAKSFQIKEGSRRFSRRTVEGVESVEKAGTRQLPRLNIRGNRCATCQFACHSDLLGALHQSWSSFGSAQQPRPLRKRPRPSASS